jgi:glycosyltransferase involved in cell wall biosynthesis
MPDPASARFRVVFNGSFLAQPHTDTRRYAEETLRAVDVLLDQSPRHHRQARFELAVPAATTAPALSAIHVTHVPGRTGHRWEQWTLRRHARGAFLINFSDSAPWLKREQLVTLHDAAARATPEQFLRRDRWLRSARMAWLGQRARSVMTLSNFSRDELQEHFGLARTDIVVGVQGGEHARRPADDAAVLQRHGLARHGYVLCLGRDTPNANFVILARALALVPAIPWPAILAAARDAGMFPHAGQPTEGLRRLGTVPDEELSALYRQAACFVLPSLYEGFGLPALEAMANDCPVLAAHAASLPEICGDAALYFDPHDACSLAAQLTRLATEPPLRHELAAAGHARLRHYRWAHNARILLDHLDALGVTG